MHFCAKRFLHPLGPSDPMSVRTCGVRAGLFWPIFGPSCRVCCSLMSYFGVPKMVHFGTSGRSQIWDLADLRSVTNQLHSLTSASSRLPPRGLLSSYRVLVVICWWWWFWFSLRVSEKSGGLVSFFKNRYFAFVWTLF